MSTEPPINVGTEEASPEMAKLVEAFGKLWDSFDPAHDLEIVAFLHSREIGEDCMLMVGLMPMGGFLRVMGALPALGKAAGVPLDLALVRKASGPTGPPRMEI